MTRAKNLINVFDFNQAEIETVFDLAKRIKARPSAFRNRLQDKVLGLIFEKPSTRTWVSFEVGLSTLGGNAIYLGPSDIQLGVREAVRDVARTLCRYLDCVVMRTFSHERILEFAKYFEKPVVNGLSNYEHPCQALADFFTLREKLGDDLKKKKIAYVGDANNVLNSLLSLSARLGVNLTYAVPRPFHPKPAVLAAVRREAKRTKAQIIRVSQPKEAVRDADAVYTDVWVSMGEEKKTDKKLHFKGFQVNQTLMKYAKKKALFMHCLPAHRGEEVTNDVIEGKHSVVFDQAENRLHIQKAILVYLLDSGL